MAEPKKREKAGENNQLGHSGELDYYWIAKFFFLYLKCTIMMQIVNTSLKQTSFLGVRRIWFANFAGRIHVSTLVRHCLEDSTYV